MQGQETESLTDEEDQNESITIIMVWPCSLLVHYLICTNLSPCSKLELVGDKKSEDYETPTNQSR